MGEILSFVTVLIFVFRVSKVLGQNKVVSRWMGFDFINIIKDTLDFYPFLSFFISTITCFRYLYFVNGNSLLDVYISVMTSVQHGAVSIDTEVSNKRREGLPFLLC